MSSECIQATDDKTNKLFKCDECKLSFSFEAIWKKHLSIIHRGLIRAEQPIECSICGDLLSTNLSLKIHLTQNHKLFNRNYKSKKSKQVTLNKKCPVCGITVKFLNEHLARKHVPERVISVSDCPKCDFKGMKSNVDRHFLQKHTTEVCPFCAETFKGGINIDRHIKNTNCGNDPLKIIPKAPCLQCNKVLKNKEKLKIHVKQIHNQIRDKQCDQCNYNTYNAGNLRLHINKIHLRKNTDKEPCPHCNKMEGNLARHIRMYHDDIK